ncbi:ankyrin repeat domain-containing protein [Cupriavidus sp. DB3]|uniref:ankyrin repeat domain-containing protein n=1 Tax=Cupriavidus sp. DB3 TaxID=2873259 RepID=UPI001CF424FC|nr:ankyrin repeat domain-containing protein [Cupriavidus sp. DB3]MCA7084171.1 ankyrin repeat domain-containing protein [Cupriavidus sp. DB3]
MPRRPIPQPQRSASMHARLTTTQPPLFQPGPVPDAVHRADRGAGGSEAGRELTLALRRHDGPAVREWLAREPTAVGWRDEQGNTPLHTAIRSRCEPELINTLLAHRADPAITNGDGDTCMHLALGMRPTMPAVVQSLLDHGRWFGGGIGLGALGKPNRHGRTALELGRDVGGAPASGHAAVLPALESALVEWMEGFRTSVLAAIDADNAAAVRHLVTTGGWCLDMPLAEELDLLQLALRYEAPRVACDIIDLAAAVDNRVVLEQAKSQLGMTPLMTAVALKAGAPFARLLLHGVPVDVQGPFGLTALHLAAASGQLHAVRQLVSYGAHPDARDETGATPIMAAASAGHLDIVKSLRDAGGNINGRDGLGRTPLMHAHLGDQPLGFILKIIMAGARTDMVDGEGRTIRDYQRESNLRRAAEGKSTCTIL